ncbi:MAG: ATP synthase F1 subunit gamma [Deltaproteobacteria bacterium]|nr:ATP synthase F1 subunit gamma [Deltaproteobacteria bacterium]
MPSLRDIRRRIGSVKSTQQITKAMKMVAAAKLRRAQEAITKARPYATLLEQALVRIAQRAASEGGAGHPLLAARPVKVVELVVITSDRGLAGGFNSNIGRRVQRFLVENADRYEKILISTIGKKGRDFFRARHVSIRKDYTGIHQKLSADKAQEIAREYGERFLSGELDAVFLVFNEFKSAISQKVAVKQLLPVETGPAEDSAGIDFLYEPARKELLEQLVPRHLDVQVFRALLDSAASEHGARMTAMESATKNATDMIAMLSLQYNRARQAYITKELSEIVSGAESLK